MGNSASSSLKVFISYSRRDMDHLDAFRKFLVPLEKYGSIEAWHDQRLAPADNWEKETMKAVNECDLALLLLSPDFLASEFINLRELPTLLERQKAGTVELLPIIIRECLWSLSPIQQFQALPKDGTPVMTFAEETGDRDKVWTDICEEIVRKAKNRPAPGIVIEEMDAESDSVGGIESTSQHPESRTCVFCELVGLHELRRKSSDQSVQQLTTRFASAIEKSAAKTGELVAVSDVKLLLAYRSPSRAIATALAIQRSVVELREEFGRSINVRIGIHQGEVIVGGSAKEGIVGRHVNCASQVCEICEPGQIIITSSVFDSAQGGNFGTPTEFIAWMNLGEYYLSAVGPMELYEVADRRVRAPAAPKTNRADLPVSARRFELADFELGERMGDSATGIVYSAIQNKSGHRVAVKVLAGGAQANDAKIEKFLSEVEAVRRCSHESIINVIELHQETMPPYYVMEYIEGKPIDEALGREDVDWNAIADTLIQVCDALQHAHEHGVIHGDLKPNNVLVGATGKPTILDFGLSTLLEIDSTKMEQSSTGVTRTPLYLSPEQIVEVDCTDVRTDVYAFGVLMYQIVTGSLPFEGSFQAVREAHLSDVPTLPVIRRDDVPEVLQRICLKAMEKSPDRRYNNMMELKADLERYRKGETVDSRPSLYNNLIESPAQKHVKTIDSWHAKQLITDKEHVALKRPYRRLLRTGLQAVSESRLVHLNVMLLYLGAWLMLAGCALWISRDWNEGLLNYSVGRIAIAVLPALLTNIYWFLLQKRGAHRLAFVAMILGLLSLPFAVVMLTHEAGNELNICWLADSASLGDDPFFEGGTCAEASSIVDKSGEQSNTPQKTDDRFQISNVQLLIALLIGVAWSGFVAKLSETTTSALVAGVQAVLLFAVMLDFAGLLNDFEDNITRIGILSIYLTIVLLTAGYIVSKEWQRSNQATPLFGLALVVGVLATQAVALDYPSSELRNFDEPELLRGFFEVLCGSLYLITALFLYRRLRLDSSAAHVVLLWLAPLCILGGIAYIGLTTEEKYFWVLLGLSAMTLLGSSYVQSYFYIACGLGFMALSLWKIQDALLQHEDYWYWPITIVVAGIAMTLAIWFKDLRARVVADMDDVGERIIRNSDSIQS